jgi:Ca-activated chloride channel family protein
MRARGVTFTALGLGADFDGPLMRNLAELGGGMYGSLASAAQLEDALERELAAARSSRVRNVELTVTGFDGVTVVDSPGRRLERRGPRGVLHLADLKPGATTHAWLRLRSPLLDESDQPRVTAAVRWFDLERDAPREVEVDVPFAMTDDEAVFEGSRDEAVFADAVRTFGMVPLATATLSRDGCFDESPLSKLVNAAHALFRLAADALASGFETLDRPDRDRAGATPGERKHQARRLER